MSQQPRMLGLIVDVCACFLVYGYYKERSGSLRHGKIRFDGTKQEEDSFIIPCLEAPALTAPIFTVIQGYLVFPRLRVEVGRLVDNYGAIVMRNENFKEKLDRIRAWVTRVSNWGESRKT